MSNSRTSPFSRLWYKWKSLQLPWRRKRLVGFDLSGNTFWEFKDQANTNRLRRIAQTDRRTHYGDVQLSPQWVQWLRYTRPEPPSLQEQQDDVQRQIQLKQLARLADERWSAKGPILQAPVPGASQAAPAPLPGSVDSAQARQPSASLQKKSEGTKTPNPWKAPGGGPGEKWQPESWKPGNMKGKH